MSLSREDVLKVSMLARLILDDDELDEMTNQLARVLQYVEQLSELDTEGVEPMAHAVDQCNVFADDELKPSLPRDEALANAPKKDGEYFLVPAVLGE